MVNEETAHSTTREAAVRVPEMDNHSGGELTSPPLCEVIHPLVVPSAGLIYSTRASTGFFSTKMAPAVTTVPMTMARI